MSSANLNQITTIMRSVKRIQKLLGTKPEYKNFWVYYTFKICIILGLLWDCIPELTFVITNLDDIKVGTSILAVLCQLITTIFKVIYLAVRIKAHYNLACVFELSTRKRSSNIEGRIFYHQAEQKSSRFTLWYTTSMLAYVLFYGIPPIVYQTYLKMTMENDSEEQTYISPFKHVYFYSLNSKFRYILTVTMSFISTFLMVVNIIAIESEFFSYCLYIEGFFKDLQSMFKLNADQDNIAHLKEAVQFNTEILNMIKQLNDLYSPIIFAQFLQSSLLICTLIFQSTLMTTMSTERITTYFFVFGASCQIFSYSYFGTIIMHANSNTAMAAYSSEWTDSSLKDSLLIRKFILFTIHRSQIEVGLDGLKIFKCNLHTFISIMNASLSALAVLQSRAI